MPERASEGTVLPVGGPALQPARRLTIWCRADDHYRHHTLVGELLRRARAVPVAGATVLEAPAGFGRTRRLRRSGVLRDAAPIRVEVVDRAERVTLFLQAIEELRPALVVAERAVQVLPGALP